MRNRIKKAEVKVLERDLSANPTVSWSYHNR